MIGTCTTQGKALADASAKNASFVWRTPYKGYVLSIFWWSDHEAKKHFFSMIKRNDQNLMKNKNN